MKPWGKASFNRATSIDKHELDKYINKLEQLFINAELI